MRAVTTTGREMKRLGYDERNVARLMLVLLNQRVPTNLQRWQKTVQVDHLSIIEVTCTAGLDQVVPHGIDSDVIFALSSLFMFQGLPADNVIQVTLADLVRYSGLTKGGTTYHRLNDSLARLQGVKYEVAQGFAFKDQQGQVGVRRQKFGIINTISFESVENGMSVQQAVSHGTGRFKPSTVFYIELSTQIADSLREGFTVEVDIEKLAMLDSPLSRSVYRSLQERRTRTQERQITIPITDWGLYLGITGTVLFHNKQNQPVHRLHPLSPTRIRRALETVHEELKKTGIIEFTDYIGKGANQSVVYFLSPHEEPLDMLAVGLLTQRKVSAERAKDLARRYTIHDIRRAVDVFERRVAGGYKITNAPGFLCDIVENPGKYAVEMISEREKPKAPRAQVSAPSDPEPTPAERRAANKFIVQRWLKEERLSQPDGALLLAHIEEGRLDHQTLPPHLSDTQKIWELTTELLHLRA